ncbi:MAG: hypothetical protein PQJ61_15815 [Spirochaetales bacterium]|uniref:Uncharacterized protein n=1 Tax=Candidatus Thalassospirochaeta sargassi TaxID=3119039 RepID=A0AAJ1MPQ7_9SPIO|nr:hypothetical protein [Spirochaetales bacterium]
MNAIIFNESTGFRRGLFTVLPIAIAIGFHPKNFIIAWPVGLIILYSVICRRRSLPEGIGFVLIPAVSAVFLVLLSKEFNSAFVPDYSSFDNDVGGFESFDSKILGFDDFYRKIFLRISGTCYTPRIWPVWNVLYGIPVIYH